MDVLNPKLTLGELLRLVGDSGNEPNPNDHVLDLHDPSPNRTRSVPFVLSFQNLSYGVNVNRNHFPLPRFLRRRPCVSDPHSLDSTLDTKTHTKVLLNGISGQAREGEILAVLGASGSGKSTLIDALAARIAKESLKGTITLNGDVLDSKLLKMISAYVMQDDLLFPMLTVEETLMFAAEFRLPRTLSKSMKKARVQALIDQLGLRNAAKTVIGDEGHRGVSGGERRRVSIGTDIIHDPILLFLDEPTSGLDSTSAYMVIKVLQGIAKSGSIVIMSIHQPSSRTLKLLDHLLFLSRGQTVFSGAPTSLHRFFTDFGAPIPPNQDRTEFVLDLIRSLETGAPGSTRALVEFAKSWQLKENNHNLNSFRNGSTTPLNSLKDAISYSISKGKLVSGATSFANPIWIEMLVIAKRSILNSIRAPELFGMRLGAVILTGIILATIFRKLDDSPKGIQERIAFFAFAMSTTFYTCAEAIPVFLMQRFIFMRETAYNAYRRSSYVLSHAIMTIPSILLLSFTFSTITFWAVGLSGGFSGFFFFFLFTTAAFWAGSSFVTFLSGIIHNIMTGYTFVVSILSYFVLFSGFFVTRDRMPGYWIWFHYASLVKYPYQGVLENEFGDPNKCFVKGVQVFDGSPLKDVPDALKLELLSSMGEDLHMEITSSTCFARGDDILQQAGVTDLNKWSCFWVTVALGFCFRILFYFTLLIGSKNKRR